MRPRRRIARLEGQVKPVDGVKKEQCPDALVEIVAAPAKGVELGAGRNQFFPGRRATDGIERPVANPGVGRGDDFSQGANHGNKADKIGFTGVEGSLAAKCQQFDQSGKNLIAVLAIEGQGELRS